MDIATPLLRLEVIGVEDTSILKANHNQLLSKGSREYVLSIREQMFTNRSFKVPEDWDWAWSVKVGPIWTPASLGSNLKCWLLPEYLSPLDTDETIVAEANDRSDSGITFENTNSTDTSPTFTAALTGSNGLEFKGMAFRDSSEDQYLYSDDESGGDEIDPGTGDFSITFLVNWGAISTSEKYVLASSNNRQFALSVKQDGSGDDKIKVYFGNVATESNLTIDSSGEFMILTVGRSGGDQFLFNAGSSSADSGIVGTENQDISNSQQFFIGSREHFSTDRTGDDGFTGDIYEIIFYNGTLSSADRQNIEGYIAHKFEKTDLLHTATHPYKSNPPRDTVA